VNADAGLLEDAGHWIPLERPDQLNQLPIELLSETPR
jgi:pimeloyl-ACP methyl ester carboxylesterase